MSEFYTLLALNVLTCVFSVASLAVCCVLLGRKEAPTEIHRTEDSKGAPFEPYDFDEEPIANDQDVEMRLQRKIDDAVKQFFNPKKDEL